MQLPIRMHLLEGQTTPDPHPTPRKKTCLLMRTKSDEGKISDTATWNEGPSAYVPAEH